MKKYYLVTLLFIGFFCLFLSSQVKASSCNGTYQCGVWGNRVCEPEGCVAGDPGCVCGDPPCNTDGSDLTCHGSTEADCMASTAYCGTCSTGSCGFTPDPTSPPPQPTNTTAPGQPTSTPYPDLTCYDCNPGYCRSYTYNGASCPAPNNCDACPGSPESTNTPVPASTATNTPVPPTATPVPPTATPTLPPCPYSCADASACALSGGTGLSGYNCGGGVCCQFGPTATYTPIPTATPVVPACAVSCVGIEGICAFAGSCTTCDAVNGCSLPAPTATNTPPPGATNTPIPTSTSAPGPATSTPTAVPTSGPVCTTSCVGNELICSQAGSCNTCNAVNGCEIAQAPTGTSNACDNRACGMPEATCTANGGLSWSPSDNVCGGNQSCCLPPDPGGGEGVPSGEPPTQAPSCTGTCRSFCLANESGGYGTSCPSLCCYPIPTTGPCTMTASVVAGAAPLDSRISFSSGTNCRCNGFSYGDGSNDNNACLNSGTSYSSLHTYNFESDPGSPYHATASCYELNNGYVPRTCSVDVTVSCPTQANLSNIAASNVVCVGGYSNTIDISGGQKVVPKSTTPYTFTSTSACVWHFPDTGEQSTSTQTSRSFPRGGAYAVMCVKPGNDPSKYCVMYVGAYCGGVPPPAATDTPTPTPTPTYTPTPTPTQAQWFKLKDTSFYRSSALDNRIPQTPSAFDTTTDDDASRNFIVGEAGTVIANGSISLNSADPSVKKWQAMNTSQDTILSPTRFIDYVKSRKPYQSITDFASLSTAKINIISKSITINNTDSSNYTAGILRASDIPDGAILVINGTGVEVKIDEDFNTGSTKSILLIVNGNLKIKSTVSEIRGIFIPSTISFSYDTTPTESVLPLKIVGNIIAVGGGDPEMRKRSDNIFKPSIFVVANPKMYIDLIRDIGTSTYEWKQLE